MRKAFPDVSATESNGHSAGMPPKLIAVVSETSELAGFCEHFTGGSVFLDSGNQLKLALSPEGAKAPRSASLGFLFSPAFWRNYREAQNRYPDMKAQNTSTNGLNLGAVLLVGKGAPGQLLFSHLEETVGSLACEEEVLKALNAMNEEPPVKKTCG